MTPDDLRTWQAQLGLSGRKAAQTLGVSYAIYKRWLNGSTPISRPVALAAAAIAAGLKPWPD